MKRKRSKTKTEHKLLRDAEKILAAAQLALRDSLNLLAEAKHQERARHNKSRKPLPDRG